MTRSPVGVLLCLLVLLIAIGIAGCGGTETGNPSSGGGAGGGGDRNPAAELGGAICGKLTDCFGEEGEFTQEECEEDIAASETLGAAFGLEEEPPPDYAQVIERVEISELSADQVAVDDCVAEIQSLECDDPDVLAVETEAGFSNVEQMIPETSCPQVFSGP